MLRNILSSSYRFLVGTLAKWVSRFLFSKKRREQTLSTQGSWTKTFPSHLLNGQRRIWFHAASVGELESLWTLIMRAADRGDALVVTVLSESAHSSIEKLNQALHEKKAKVIFVGYSPLEGSWFSPLSLIRPHFFITAKYEAWPELWIALAQFNIPLVIISAQVRNSLLLAKRICTMVFGRLPRMFLFVALSKDLHPLMKNFSDATVEWVGEPRWDRVFQRKSQGSARARELIHLLEPHAEHPWGVIGSAWLEDLKMFRSSQAFQQGTLWVVPHRVDSISIHEICNYLQQELKVSPILTSNRFELLQQFKAKRSSRATPICVVVDEIGFLSELYSFADWAFVGGGYGAGVHSTIEPAVSGIPLACGPRGVGRFSEIDELQETKQLTVVSNEGELQIWFTAIKVTLQKSEMKQQWIEEAQGRLGASQKIWDALEKIHSPC